MKDISKVRTNIGKTMMKYRKQKKIPRTYIADKMGISDVAIYYWETGRNPITVEDLQTYSELIDVDWIQILQESSKE